MKRAKKKKVQVPILQTIKATIPMRYLNSPQEIEVGRTPLVLGTIAITVAALRIVGSLAIISCAGRDQPKKKAPISTLQVGS